MSPWHLYSLGGAVLVLLLGGSTWQYRVDRQKEASWLETFYQGCAGEGLRKSEAPMPEARWFCVGEFSGVHWW